jgi:integrase
MPARRTGSLTARQTRRGVVFDLRFTATVNGKPERQNVTLRDMSREDAERELRGILADVERGTWQPPAPPPVVNVADDPTFHEFATDWFEASKHEWREGTQADYEWQLSVHLLPFFRQHRLSQITVAEVDRYRQSKVAAGKLGPTSINKTITRLAQILEVAVEYGHMPGNPARGKRRRVKPRKPQRTYLDTAGQISALLDAAGELDAEARATAKLHRRALLATLTFAGLRISELIALDWRDVDLAAGRLTVRASKTDAGLRQVDLLPVLAAELRALKAEVLPGQDDPVFPSATGTRQDRNRVRTRVLAKAVARADKALVKAGQSALPDGMTLHALRRTFGSVLIALGHDNAYVMGQMGHTSPMMTLGVYAKSIRPEERARLRALVNGDDVARSGDEAALTAAAAPALAAS